MLFNGTNIPFVLLLMCSAFFMNELVIKTFLSFQKNASDFILHCCVLPL